MSIGIWGEEELKRTLWVAFSSLHRGRIQSYLEMWSLPNSPPSHIFETLGYLLVLVSSERPFYI